MGANTSTNKTDVITTSITRGPFTILVVDFAFEIENGFLGMNRDVILRLCNCVWHEPDKIRLIMGICQEHCGWREHSYFVKNRPSKVVVLFRPNSQGGCTISPQPALSSSPAPVPAAAAASAPLQCAFESGPSRRTVFLDRLVTQGIYKWTVKIQYGSGNENSYFWFGGAQPESLDKCDANSLGMNVRGTWSFAFQQNKGKLTSNVYGMRTNFYIPRLRGTPVPDGSTVAVEVNSYSNTLCFFVNGTKIPHALSAAVFPFYLGMSACAFGRSAPSFTSLSFFRLPAATPSTVVCTLYKYKGM